VTRENCEFGYNAAAMNHQSNSAEVRPSLPWAQRIGLRDLLITVIIPVAHRETVFDLTDSEVAATFRLLRRVKAWMDAEFSPDGYNVGWNCGRVGGQEVFHAHLHVIPRFRQEPLAGQGIRSHLKSEANRW
jgi:HIT domain